MLFRFFSFFLSFFTPPFSLPFFPLLVKMDSSVSSPALREDAAPAPAAASAAAAPLPTALLLAEDDATAAAEAAAATTATTTTTTTTTANGLPIPRGLQEALRGLAREALRHQPEDVVEFARWYVCVSFLKDKETKERRAGVF